MTAQSSSLSGSVLQDQAERTRIASDTGETLFVEAAAGSGKTRSLVDRVTALVLTDGIPLSALAAVTFTNKAGAELRDRLRTRFQQKLRRAHGASGAVDADDLLTERARQALEDLDSAAIGTLHSFAQRILSLHPIEAGLPPLVEVMDEMASSVAFEAQWVQIQQDVLDDPTLTEPLALALAAGLRLDDLRDLARKLNADWDLIEDRIPPSGISTPALPDISGLVRAAQLLAARASESSDPSDRFIEKLAALRDWAVDANQARSPVEQQQAVLAAVGLSWSFGRKANWPDLEGLKQDCQTWKEQAADISARFTEASTVPLVYAVAQQVLIAAAGRASTGRLEFQDLLVLARRVLTGRRGQPVTAGAAGSVSDAVGASGMGAAATAAEVRAALQRRFRVLLLDEFQDTDPIQIELAVRIAGGANADAAKWTDVEVPAGSLFVVGDPKQSIYRFRRASIATYLQAQHHLGETVGLTTNFRTVAPILEWVNIVFGTLIQAEDNAQPEYRPLRAHRTDCGEGPAVVLLGATEHEDKPKADELRSREAADVAAVIEKALTDGWTTYDTVAEVWRPIAPADIAILVPTRRSLEVLAEALDEVGVSYVGSTASPVYQSQQIRDLMAAARALADPTDQLSCVTALRSALFGCGDDDLWGYRRGGGSFTVSAPVPAELVDTQVGQAMEYLHDLHRQARWLSPSKILYALAADRRVAEVAAEGSRRRDSWRQLRFVIDQARAWSEAEHGGLRAYLDWASRQADDSSRASEVVVPETDVDAVTIMTVHAAKGLEFGMVVLSGMTSGRPNSSGARLLWPADGGLAARIRSGLQTRNYQDAADTDAHLDDMELRRLLYVATTRARDHLVVSLHRKPLGERTPTTRSELLVEAGALKAPGSVSWVSATASPAPSPKPRPVASPPDWNTWSATVATARETSTRPAAISASSLEGSDWKETIGLDAVRSDAPVGGISARDPVNAAASDAGRLGKQPAGPDGDSTAGNNDAAVPAGRSGVAIGRAVHAVLQTVDLAAAVPDGGDDPALAATVAAACQVEQIASDADLVIGLVRSALESPVMAHAATRPHWRETWAATTLADGTVLEGIVDLLYSDEDGGDGSLVVVDYKTDAVPAAAIKTRATFYEPQMRAYVHAVRAATGKPTTGTLLFLHPTKPATAVRLHD